MFGTRCGRPTYWLSARSFIMRKMIEIERQDHEDVAKRQPWH
jgi:hypothetical protein